MRSSALDETWAGLSSMTCSEARGHPPMWPSIWIWLNGADLRGAAFLTELSTAPTEHPAPQGSAIISEALSVEGRGHKLLFELMCAHDLEGVVAKRLKDGVGRLARVRWLKIKNPCYSQNEGRRELFDKRKARGLLPRLRAAVRGK